MANWLQKITAPPAPGKKANLPVKMGGRLPSTIMGGKPPEGIPNASVIYGVAAAVLFGVSLYFLFTGKWFTGILVCALAVALFGFAFHFIRYGK